MRNQHLVNEVASGRPSRLITAVDVDSLLRSREALQKLFAAARAKNPQDAAARQHVRQVRNRVATPDLAKSPGGTGGQSETNCGLTRVAPDGRCVFESGRW